MLLGGPLQYQTGITELQDFIVLAVFFAIANTVQHTHNYLTDAYARGNEDNTVPDGRVKQLYFLNNYRYRT